MNLQKKIRRSSLWCLIFSSSSQYPMDISIRIQDAEIRISSEPVDLAIPVRFNGPQPNTYGVPGATAKAYEGEGFVGDVNQGGSCNFEQYQLIPHCNGTHTEGVGHITGERINVHEVVSESFFPATVLTVSPKSGADCQDEYRPSLDPDDLVITRSSLEFLLTSDSIWLEALIIRTTPNPADKMSRDYLATPPAFFSHEAMQLIRSLGVKHLLVDIPSVDRMFDDGHLDNHHEFWSVPKDSHDVPDPEARKRTITEMIYVPDSVADGKYLLELQIAPWLSDAAPSRPRLFSLL